MNDIADIISAFGTLIIGAIVAWIAWRQHKTDHNKFRLELYDRRLRLYEAAMAYIGVVVQRGKADDQCLIEFNRSVRESLFLFSKELEEYFTILYTKGIELKYANDIINDQNIPIGEDRTKAAREHADLVKWFAKQFDEVKERVARHMSLV